MAGCVQQGNLEGAQKMGSSLNLSEQQHKALREILDATRVQSKSSSSSEPPLKRATKLSEFPPILQRQWDVLSMCNRQQNDALFLRAQAKALKTLIVPLTFLEKPTRVKNEIFDFLGTEGLCAMSGCCTEINYQVKVNIPGVWRRIAQSYSLPQSYWPDLSRERCLQNFRHINKANQDLERYVQPNGPLVRVFTIASGYKPAELRSKIQDPLKQFLKHTLPLMKTVMSERTVTFYDSRRRRNMTRTFTSEDNTLGVVRAFAQKCPEKPRDMLNLFFLCGYPKTLSAAKIFFPHGYIEEEQSKVIDEWLAALEDFVCECPLPKSGDSQRSTKEGDHFFYQMLDLAYLISKNDKCENKTAVLRILNEVLNRGLILGPECIGFYFDKCELFPLSLHKRIIEAARGNVANHLPMFMSRYFGHNELFRRENPEDLAATMKLFGWPKVPFSMPIPVPVGGGESLSGYFRRAAETQSHALMQALTDIGIRPENGVENNTLTFAIKRKASLDEISFLCIWGAKPSWQTFNLIGEYSNDEMTQGMLRALLSTYK